MRPLSTFVFLTLATAAIGIACGEVARNDGPAAHTAVPADGANNDANVAISASRVDICHFEEETGTYYDIQVPEPAVAAHIGHGDSPGPCAVPCPCYTAEQIDSLGSICSLTCVEIEGEPYLEVGCGGGTGSTDAWLLGSNTAQATCFGEDGQAGQSTGLTPNELQSCQAIIQSTGLCPDSN